MERKIPDLNFVGCLALPEFREATMVYAQGDTEEVSPQELADKLELPISDYRLLCRALTHRSYLNEHPEALEDNERLEFLGDAVLDFLVGAWLYNHFPEMAEGEMTRLRSALVRTEQLAGFAQLIGLGSAMRLGRGESEGGGRNRPALLCGTFEALVGAIYLDAGIGAVQNLLEPMLDNAVHDILAENSERDSKSLLQEWIQARGYEHPIYKTIASYGPDHAKEFEVEVLVDGRVLGRGRGHSKQAAAHNSATKALETLEA
jgi:ribonuclease-3